MAAVAMLAFASCKKDNDKSANHIIEGKWTGTFKEDGEDWFFSLNFKAGGIIEELDENGQKIGVGTWEMENNIIQAEWDMLPPLSAKYSLIAAFYKDKGKLLGDWGYGTNATNGGTFQMSK